MDTPNTTDDWVLPDTLSVPHPLNTLFHQEVFTNPAGLGQVSVIRNYVRLQFEKWHAELVVFLSHIHFNYSFHSIMFNEFRRYNSLGTLPKMGGKMSNNVLPYCECIMCPRAV